MGTGVPRYSTIDPVARALASPTRRYMLAAMAVRPCSMTDLINFVLMSQQGVSYHLGVLRDAGLIRFHGAYGSAVTYTVNTARLSAFMNYIEECLVPRDDNGSVVPSAWPLISHPPRPRLDLQSVGEAIRMREGQQEPT